MSARLALPILCGLLSSAAPQEVPLPEGLPLHTRFARRVPAEGPRPEYPRPQMVRDDWISLNGMWDLLWERGDGGWRRSGRIRVPFAPESALSGLFLGQEIVEHAAYSRRFQVPDHWSGGRILLHFQAVDWRATVRVDGREAGRHEGGYDPFTLDITGLLGPGPDHRLEVDVFDPADPEKDGWQPRGKQLGSRGIWYTRTTGIWQSVWLEPVPATFIEGLSVRAEADGRLEVEVRIGGAPAPAKGLRVRARVDGLDRGGRPVRAEGEAPAGGPPLALVLPGIRPWSPEDPALADLDLSLLDGGGRTLDRVRSYCGFRTVAVRDGAWTLNGAPYFLRGVLDQGYWPEGGLTAPSDEALRHDVELARTLGLNLARKHVKVEDGRWYSWCDRLGLLVMQDMPSSQNLAGPAAREGFLRELDGMVRHLRNHPSVVHWVVFNEDWGKPGPFQTVAVDRVRALDPTRPITDASGWHQGENTDVTDIHDYGADLLRHGGEAPARPRILGECGGVAFWQEGHVWSPGWGYSRASSADGFVRRVARLASQAFEAPGLSGYVWTQLTDVEQELNGLVHYDRTPKADPERLRRALQGLDRPPPAIGPDRWLVLGPIPSGTSIASAEDSPANRAALAGALSRPFLAGEGALDPRPGEEATAGDAGFVWREVAAPARAVDLRRNHGGDPRDCVSYAVGTFDLATAARATLLFGSDDAARVWINGRLAHEVVAVRGVSPGGDEVAGIELPAGRNRVVVKVAQGLHGFGFSLFLEPEP